MAKQQILINNSNRIDTGSVALIKELRKAGIIKTGRKRRAPKEILAVNDATGGADTTPMYRTVMQAPSNIYQRIPDRDIPQFGRVGANDLGRNNIDEDVVRNQQPGQNVFGDAQAAPERDEGLPQAAPVFEGGDPGIRPPEGQRGVGEAEDFINERFNRYAGMPQAEAEPVPPPEDENIKRGGGGRRPSFEEVMQLIFNEQPRLRVGYDSMSRQPSQRLRFILREFFGFEPPQGRNQEELKEYIISYWVRR